MTPPRRLPNLCYKTRMCKFFAMGACDRGDACTFAHLSADLHPVPDLSRTQVCPMLINTGRCDSPGCSFAHNAGELRKGPFGFANQQVIRRRGRCGSEEQLPPLKDEPQALPPPSRPAPPAFADVAAPPKIQEAGLVVPSHACVAPSHACVEAPVPPPPPPPAAAPLREKEGGHGKVHKKRALAFRKTRMCVFHQAGRCFKRENCNFAHSHDELRKVPESGRRAPSSKALCALFDQCPQRLLAAGEEDQEVTMVVKNTFLELELPTESKIRRSASCPALLRLELADDLSEDLSTPRAWQRETSAPAHWTGEWAGDWCCDESPFSAQDEPSRAPSGPRRSPPQGQLPLCMSPPIMGLSVPSVSYEAEGKFALYDGACPIQAPTPPVRVAEAHINVPGMTVLPEPAKMFPQMMVPVCAVQQDYQLVEIPFCTANMTDVPARPGIDMIVLPARMIGC